MTKLVIESNVAGTGVLTVFAPSTSNTATITLPTSSGTLVSTGGAQTVEFGTGSNSAPSITFTGDTNTGIYSSGADAVNFTEGGSGYRVGYRNLPPVGTKPDYLRPPYRHY